MIDRRTFLLGAVFAPLVARVRRVRLAAAPANEALTDVQVHVNLDPDNRAPATVRITAWRDTGEQIVLAGALGMFVITNVRLSPIDTTQATY